ncbi:MAG: hypothetical protein JSU82_08645 [Rhodospirillales bacterium]|nr:MAG: hypothetical protein JSU82_08645 [Rhodospirillales bacterium]
MIAALQIVAGAVGDARADDDTPPGELEIVPVPRLFERVHNAFSGRILTVELAQSEIPAYEVKLLTESGNVLLLSYDATSLRLNSVVGHRNETDVKDATVTFVGEAVAGEDANESDDADDRDDDRDDGGDDDEDDEEDDRADDRDDDRDDGGDDRDDDGADDRDDDGDDDRDDDGDNSGSDSDNSGSDSDNSGPGGDDSGSGGNSGPGGGDDD